MADTYTSNLRFTKPEIGANNNAWGPLLNNGMIALLDAAIAGETAVNVTAGDESLSENNGESDEARAMFLRITGTPGTLRNVNTASGSKVYIVKNDSDSDVVIRDASATSGVTIAPGQMTMVYIEEGVGAFEATTAGEYVQQNASSLDSLTLDINTSTGGDTQTSMLYTVQGSYVFLTIDGFEALGCSGTLLSLSNAAGDWPSEIVPASRQTFPVIMYEDTGSGYALFAADINIAASPSTSWNISAPITGGPFTGGSDRQVLHSITAVYPIQGGW